MKNNNVVLPLSEQGSPNDYYSAIIAVVNRHLKNGSKEMEEICSRGLLNLMFDEYPQEYVDTILQKGTGYANNYNIYDAYGFYRFHAAFMAGLISFFQIPLNETPYKDKQVKENNNILKTLPEPFSGIFYKKRLGADGEISWSQPINALVCNDGKIFYTVLPPMSVSLEVGTTDVGKSNWYITGNDENGFARIPYNQKFITVYINNSHCDHLGLISNSKDRKNVFGGDFYLFSNPLEVWNWNNHKSFRS